MTTIHDRRHERRKTTGEDFTPPELVNEMLSRLGRHSRKSYLEESFTYCDPACGNGNILVEILKMKLANGHDPSVALATLFGCDIKRDNIRECRLRLLKEVRDAGTKITVEHIKTVFNQVVLTSLERFRDGALGYDFSFVNKASGKDVDAWIDGIENEGWLDDPSATSESLGNADAGIEDAQEDDLWT